MKKIDNISFIILKIVYSASSNKLDSYSVFKRTRISFPDFSAIINKLKAMGYIYVDGIIISITNSGREYVLMYHSSYENKNREWRNVPQSMLGPKLAPNYKYVPSLRLLDKKLKSNLDN